MGHVAPKSLWKLWPYANVGLPNKVMPSPSSLKCAKQYKYEGPQRKQVETDNEVLQIKYARIAAKWVKSAPRPESQDARQ